MGLDVRDSKRGERAGMRVVVCKIKATGYFIPAFGRRIQDGLEVAAEERLT